MSWRPHLQRDEWVTFKQLMSKNYRSGSILSMATKILQSEIVKEQYPNLLTLLTISLILPVSSVDCERGGFSKHNLIKTRTRGRLKTDHVYSNTDENVIGNSGTVYLLG